MAQPCVRCAAPLNTYNNGRLCGACEVAVRDRVGERSFVLPLSFWFRSDLREALERWAWGAVLVAVSAETNASQEQLAAAVGLSQAQVSRLMSGRSREPSIRSVLGIVDGLGIPRLLAGLAPRGLEHLARHALTSVERVKRRTFGRAAIGITLALPLTGAQADEPIDVTRVHPDDVVADLYALDARYGGAVVSDVGRRRLLSLTRQVERAVLTPSVETRMQSMIGALATCCAWLSFDAGDHRRARAFDTDALCAAHLANNADLQVEVLASMSMQAKKSDRLGESINLAESAMTIARGADPRLKSLLSMRIALAEAKRRDWSAFKKHRRAAWVHLERANQRVRPAWFQFFDDRELSALEALGFMELGNNEAAAKMLAEVVDQQHTHLRNKSYYSAVRAQALVGTGALDEAVAAITHALPLFTEVTSARTFNRLRSVHAGMRPFIQSPDIADCCEIIEGLRP